MSEQLIIHPFTGFTENVMSWTSCGSRPKLLRSTLRREVQQEKGSQGNIHWHALSEMAVILHCSKVGRVFCAIEQTKYLCN